MEKQLRQPENWQDFETLCKKLWGEIWNCSEIKKHGTVGQSQLGVDLYGIPDFEMKLTDVKKFYGIQCKKKDINKNDEITIKEINEEVEKAKEFKPELKKYYIATTAKKTVAIEEYVRTKSLESIQQGSFQIDIFFWEDIVSLIDENKGTHDWYVKNKGFKNNYKITFMFDEDKDEITLTPTFKKKITDIKLKSKTPNLSIQQIEIMKLVLGVQNLGELVPAIYNNSTRNFLTQVFKNINRDPLTNPPINLSRVDFAFKIINEGNIALEHYKIILKFIGNFKEIGVCTRGNILTSIKHSNNSFMKESNKAELVPTNKVLVPFDQFEFDTFYLFPNPKSDNIEVNWDFISKDYNESGKLQIRLEPIFKEKYNITFVENENEVGNKIEYSDFKVNKRNMDEEYDD